MAEKSNIHIQKVTGALDLDSPVELIKNGDYVEAFNISAQSTIRKEGDKLPCIGIQPKGFVFRSKPFPHLLSERINLWEQNTTILSYNFGSSSVVIKQRERTHDEIKYKLSVPTFVYLIRYVDELPGDRSEEESIRAIADSWEVIEMCELSEAYLDHKTSITGYEADGVPVLLLANRKIGIAEIRLTSRTPSNIFNILHDESLTIKPEYLSIDKQPSYAPPGVTIYSCRVKRADGSMTKFSRVSDPVSIPYSYNAKKAGPCNIVYLATDFNPKAPTIKSMSLIDVKVDMNRYVAISGDDRGTVVLYATRFFQNDSRALNTATSLTFIIGQKRIEKDEFGYSVTITDGYNMPTMSDVTWKTVEESAYDFTAFDNAKTICCKEGILYAANVRSRFDEEEEASNIFYDARVFQLNKMGMAIDNKGSRFDKSTLYGSEPDDFEDVIWGQTDLHKNYLDMIRHSDNQDETTSLYTVYNSAGAHGATGPNVEIEFVKGVMDVGGVYADLSLPNDDIEEIVGLAGQDPTMMNDPDTYYSAVMRGCCAPALDVGGRRGSGSLDTDVDKGTGLKKHRFFTIGGTSTIISKGDNDQGHSFANPSFSNKLRSMQHDSVYYLGCYFTLEDGTRTEIYPMGAVRTPSMSDPEFRLFDDHVLCEKTLSTQHTFESELPGGGKRTVEEAQFTEMKAYPVYMRVLFKGLPKQASKVHVVYATRDFAHMNVKGMGIVHQAQKPFDDSPEGGVAMFEMEYKDVIHGGYFYDKLLDTWFRKGYEGGPTFNPNDKVTIRGLGQEYYQHGQKYSLSPIPSLLPQWYFYGGTTNVSLDDIDSQLENVDDGTIKVQGGPHWYNGNCPHTRAAMLITPIFINCPEERGIATGNYIMSNKTALDGKPDSFSQYASFSGRKVQTNLSNKQNIYLFHCPEIDFTDAEGKSLVPINYDDNQDSCFCGHGMLTSLVPAAYDRKMLSAAYSPMNDGFGYFDFQNCWNRQDPLVRPTFFSQFSPGQLHRTWFKVPPEHRMNDAFDYPAAVYDTLFLANNYTFSSRETTYATLFPDPEMDAVCNRDNDPADCSSLHFCMGSILQTQWSWPILNNHTEPHHKVTFGIYDAIVAVATGGIGLAADYLLSYAGNVVTDTGGCVSNWLDENNVGYDEKGMSMLHKGTPPRTLKFLIRHTECMWEETVDGHVELHVEGAHRAIIPLKNTEVIDFGVKTFKDQFVYLWPCSHNKEVRFGGHGFVDGDGVPETNIGGNVFVNLSPLWSGRVVPALNEENHLYMPPDSIVQSSDRNRMHGWGIYGACFATFEDAVPPIPNVMSDAVVTPIADHGAKINYRDFRFYENHSDVNYFKKYTTYTQFCTNLKQSAAFSSATWYSLAQSKRIPMETIDFLGDVPGDNGKVYPDVLWGGYKKAASSWHPQIAIRCDLNIVRDKPYLRTSDWPVSQIFNYDMWDWMKCPGVHVNKFNYWAGSVTADFFCGVNHHGWGGRMMGCMVDFSREDGLKAPMWFGVETQFPFGLIENNGMYLMDKLWDGTGKNTWNTQEVADQYPWKLFMHDVRPKNVTLTDDDKNPGKLVHRTGNSFYGMRELIRRSAQVLSATYRTPAINYVGSIDKESTLWADTEVLGSDDGIPVNKGTFTAGGIVTNFDCFVGIHKKLYTHAYYPSSDNAHGIKEYATGSSPTIIMFPYEGTINVAIANECEDILKAEEQTRIANKRQWVKRGTEKEPVIWKTEFANIKQETDLYGYNAVFSCTEDSPEQLVKPDLISIRSNSHRLFYSIYNYSYKEFDIFRPGNYCDLDSMYGRINNLHIQGNNLFAFQDAGVAAFTPMMPIPISSEGGKVVFSNTLAKNTGGNPDFAQGDFIDEGDGSVLSGRFTYLAKGYGCELTNSDSIFSNDDGVYWLDTNSKSIMRVSKEGVHDIGKEYHCDAWAAAASEVIHNSLDDTCRIYGTYDKAVRFCVTDSVILANEAQYTFGDSLDKRCIQLEEMAGGFTSFISFAPDATVTIDNRGVSIDTVTPFLLHEGGHNAWFLPSVKDVGMSLTSFVNVDGTDILDKQFYGILWRYKNPSSVDRIIYARMHSPQGIAKAVISQVYHYTKNAPVDADGKNLNQFTGEMGGLPSVEGTIEGIISHWKQLSVITHGGSNQQGYISASLSNKEIGRLGGMGLYVKQDFQTFSSRSRDEIGRTPDSNTNEITPWNKRFGFYFSSFMVSYDAMTLF